MLYTQVVDNGANENGNQADHANQPTWPLLACFVRHAQKDRFKLSLFHSMQRITDQTQRVNVADAL